MAMKDKLLAISTEKSLPKVLSSLMGQNAFATLYTTLPRLRRMIMSIVIQRHGYPPSSRIALYMYIVDVVYDSISTFLLDFLYILVQLNMFKIYSSCIFNLRL